jgi:hypothetical protein
MKKIFYLIISFVMMVSSCVSGDGWTDLFNGKDLTGFLQLNGKAPFRAEDGMLIGVTVKGQPNSFLATEQDYDDFILEFDVWCDPALNSGVQFRSESRPDYHNGHVYGYQCEIDPASTPAWNGGIYDEERRGWLVTLQEHPSGMAAYKKNDWNHFRIEAFGDTMRTWVNGVNTANLLDNMTPKGFIAFQIHSVWNNKTQDGKEIKWKNIRILTKNIKEHLMQGTLAPEVNRIPNVLSSAESADGWKLLFDGKTNLGWRGAHKEAFPDKGWKIDDGMITVVRSDGSESTNGGDIVTMDEYTAFELRLEFKITEGANSGIKYFVTEAEKQKGSAFGLEYQILDDRKHPDAKLYTSVPGSRACAGLYDLIAPRNVYFNGVGQWNLAVLKVFPNNQVEHWLNGIKTVAYERGSDEFRKLVAGSKYAARMYHENGRFGEAPRGRILLQDHGDEVSFRSIKIKALK